MNTIKVARNFKLELAVEEAAKAVSGDNVVLHNELGEDYYAAVLNTVVEGVQVTWSQGHVIKGQAPEPEKLAWKMSDKATTESAVAEEGNVSRLKRNLFGNLGKEESTTTTKEEKKMKFTFNVKDNKVFKAMKKATGKVVSFVKKHVTKSRLVKSAVAFGATVLAGTFSTGVLSALAGGAFIYQVAATAYRMAIKKEAFFPAASRSGWEGMGYAFLSVPLTYTALWLLANVVLQGAYYVAVGFIYSQYFILG